MVDGLNGWLLVYKVPTFFARLFADGTEMSIDGRQKNVIFHFPSLQTPRRLRRGQSSTGENAGWLSWRFGGSNGIIRSHSREGARIVRIGVIAIG
jgi:hypothetical protein